jgi:hypothetical protein
VPSERGDARNRPDGQAEGADRAQDPIVGRLRPDPAQRPEPALELTGFLGDSDRPGFRRLYFTRTLDYYCEFRMEDVLHTAGVPAGEAPFAGEEATRLSLKMDATVEYTRTRTARPPDEFDLDVRLGPRYAARGEMVPGDTLHGWTMCEWPGCETRSPTVCGDQCLSQQQTFCGICPVPYTAADPTCAATCGLAAGHAGYTCVCPRVVVHNPSDIPTACLPACPDPVG